MRERNMVTFVERTGVKEAEKVAEITMSLEEIEFLEGKYITTENKSYKVSKIYYGLPFRDVTVEVQVAKPAPEVIE